MSTAQKFAISGLDVNVETLAIYDYIRVAFTFDPDIVWIDNVAHLNLKQSYVATFSPTLAKMNAAKYSNALVKLVSIGFLVKSIYHEQAFYRIGHEARMFEGFTKINFDQIQVETTKHKEHLSEEQIAEKIARNKKWFFEQAVQAARELKAETETKPIEERIIFTKPFTDEFVAYWTAPLQNKPTKMLYEAEKTFVFKLRMRTAWNTIFKRRILTRQ